MRNRTFKLNREWQTLCCFLFFPLLLLCLFGLWPIIHLVYLSFTSWNGISDEKVWIGLDNYRRILTDPVYLHAFKVNGYYLVSGLLQIIVALYFAILLSFKVAGKKFFSATFVFPMLISPVAISMLFRLFFSPDGAFDRILLSLGLEHWIGFWLGDPQRVNITLAGISFWRNLGLSFLLFYGGIQSIPLEYFKVADSEGASFFQKVRYIILPNIQRVLGLTVVLLTIGVVSVFEIPLIMTNGSNGTATVLVQTMKLAFDQKKFGMASSLAVLLTLILVSLSLIQKKIKGTASHEKN